MLGFLIGTACLVGLVAMVRQGRRHRRWGRGFGRGPRGFLNGIFSKLDTSPSQEKVIVAAVEEVRGALSSLRGEARTTRSDVARMLSSESFDAEHLGAVFSRHDDALREARLAFGAAMGKVHAALDPAQRATLARMLESGPPWMRGRGGPYRDGVAI